MKRIIVIGCPGSGKTTLSKELSAKLGLPLIHLDKLGWRGNWEQVPKDEFDKALHNELIKPEWIIDGNYSRTIPERLKYCDTVIYLDFPRRVSLFGVIKRVIKGYGKSRGDMGGNCPEKFDAEFLKFVWGFRKKHKENYEKMLKEQKEIDVITLHSHREVSYFLSDLIEANNK